MARTFRSRAEYKRDSPDIYKTVIEYCDIIITYMSDLFSFI